MICAKIHEGGRDRILAACDRELLGKELGDFKVSARFYGGEDVGEEEFLRMAEGCTIINMVGERVINAAKRKSLIRENGFMLVSGVPHAQVVRML